MRRKKHKLKEWWAENKTVIKTAVTCLSIGALYGFIKGSSVTADAFLKPQNSESTDEDFVYDETTVDDPDLLELIDSD